MTVHVISMWHNEDFLEPLFHNHYARADRITILHDEGPALDDIEKVRRLNCAANESDADVRIIVDADEFVYPIVEPELVQPGSVYVVDFWEVFRHKSDLDIDRAAPPLQQRIHGNEHLGESFGQPGMFCKPIVFGKGVTVNLDPGNHHHEGPHPIVRGNYRGAHWAMADVVIAVQRRMIKKMRMSKRNLRNGLTSHDWNVTEQEIIDECWSKEDSPWVVNTGRRRY